VAALALVAVSFVKVGQHLHDPSMVQQGIAHPQVGPADQNTAFLLFVRTMNDGQEVFQNALHGDATEVDAAVAKLEGASPPDFKSDQLRRQLVILLKDAKQLPPPVAQPPTQNQKGAPDPRNKLKLDYKSWKAEYDQWTKPKA
jgi:hypothetical protein